LVTATFGLLVLMTPVSSKIGADMLPVAAFIVLLYTFVPSSIVSFLCESLSYPDFLLQKAELIIWRMRDKDLVSVPYR